MSESCGTSPERTTRVVGVEVHPLRRIIDPRGVVLHMLRATDPYFEGFGEIYFSGVNPGAVKGWRRHRAATSALAVPMGLVRFVFYDDRPTSASFGLVEEMEVGGSNYCLVVIPPGIWHGSKGLSSTVALVANCSTIPHDPAEADRRDPDDPAIPYDWEQGKRR